MRTPSRSSAARAFLVLLSAGLALAPAARAEFRALAPPPGALDAFAASGDDWAGFHGSPPQAVATRDGGMSWQALQVRGAGSFFIVTGGMSVGPDGALYAGIEQQSGPMVLRMPRGGDGFDPASLAFPPLGGFAASAPAWEGGRIWVAASDGQVLALMRFNADGSLAERHDTAAGGCGGGLAVQVAGGRVYARCGSRVWQLRGTSLVQVSGTGSPLSFGSAWPVLVSGGAVLAERALSLDGGERFGLLSQNNLRPVHGSDRLLAELARLVGAGDGGVVLSRFSNWLWRGTPLRLPVGTTDVWQVRQGLLAVSVGGFTGESVFALHGGAVPQLRPQRVPGYGGRMLARANAMRRAAGLPPLVGSRAIARATTAHVRWVNARLDFRRRINYHEETPGSRGFTGRTPQERCARAGTTCGGEVLNAGNQALRPVDNWVATPYHRPPFTSPLGSIAGAARVGRVAGMNFDDLPGVFVAPRGYPIGRYDGPLAFPGNETPDPIAACRRVGQPVRNPGTPVTVAVPLAAEPVAISVTQGGRRLRGCSRLGFFFPSAPLRPRTRYRVRAAWRPVDGAPLITYAWTFRTR